MINMDFRELYKKAVYEQFGAQENLEIIEKRIAHLRQGMAIRYEDLEIIADDNLWPFSKFWTLPDKEKIESTLKETQGILSRVKEESTTHERDVILRLNAVFKSISLVSILLRFTFPEHYGIYSPPVLHISGTERGKNEIEDYINYLSELRRIFDIYEIRQRYRAERVADIDMLLLAVSTMGGIYLDEFNL